MSSQRIVHAHDAFVRTVMSDLRIAREFFAIHLPNDIRELIDFNCLILQPRSYIDEVRKESTVDMLYKTMIAGQEAFLYLIVEHQSSPDELMPFRMLKYICNIMDHHLKITKQKKLPLVYPMVIYHGERPYPYSTDIRDIVDCPRTLIDQYFLKPFQLIDLGQIDDEELKEHAWVGVMEFVLKHIYARNVFPYVQDIIEILHRISRSGGLDFVSIVLQYLLERGEMTDKQAFFELINTQISSEVGDKIMTLAEQLIDEGMHKGMHKGRIEGKREGILEGKREGILEGKREGILEGKREGILEGKREGILEGKREGILEGKREGILEGRQETMLEIAKLLLSEGNERSFVAKITGLSLENLETLFDH